MIALVIGFFMFSASGAGRSSGVIWLIPGFIALIAGIILMAPFFLAVLARVGRKAPIATRLALRDLSRVSGPVRFRSLGHQRRRPHCGRHLRRRPSPAIATSTTTSGRIWHRTSSPSGALTARTATTPIPVRRRRRSFSRRRPASTPSPLLSAPKKVVELDNPAPSVGLQSPSASGRQWNGQIYVATPALLRAYDINPSSIPSDVDVLSSRPGLSGSGVQLTYGGGTGKGGGQLVGPGPGGPPVRGGGPGPGNTNTCSPTGCIAHPVVQDESQLPTGTDAPNTLITESALRRLHLASQSSLDGWIVQANSPITSAQITNAQTVAATTTSASSRGTTPRLRTRS